MLASECAAGDQTSLAGGERNVHRLVGSPGSYFRRIFAVIGHYVQAYLDPGTGSMLLQAIVGGVAAAAVAGRIFWRQILELLHIRKKEDRP
jgi:hypothetical protein